MYNTIDVHTQYSDNICSPLKSATDNLNSAKSFLSDINIPADFDRTDIDDAINNISNAIMNIDDTIGLIGGCVRRMESAELNLLSSRYQILQSDLSKDVSVDIGGYSKDDKIDKQKVLLEVIEVAGIDNWIKMDNRAKRILLNAEYIHKYMEMEEHPYEYCVYGNNSLEEHKHDSSKHGLNNTFEESKHNKHNTCCATYVSWVLEDAGLLKIEDYQEGADNLQEVLKTNGWQIIENEEDLQPGDILGYNHHIEIYAGKDDEGNKIIYNAGDGDWIRSEGPDTREKLKEGNKPFKIAYRIPSNDMEV